MKRLDFNQNWTISGETVTLPHDAMIHELRTPDAACGSAGAFFPGKRYIYEKTFERPKADHVVFQFEGVYKDAKVLINGREAGGCAYGYLPFFIQADDYLADGENTIRVECGCEGQPDSRWYSGAGIYRPVWMWEGPKNSIEPESIQISTKSYNPPVIQVCSETEVTVSVGAVSGSGTEFELELPEAGLWSEETPNLLTASVTNGSDSEEIRFGIRKVEWSPKGLFINGVNTLLRGGCVHHDSGILGAATYDESEYRRVRKLKEAGFNAIRSAHNPCSRAMLDACDELGVYIMDEAWDMWFQHKSKHDYAAHWQENHLDDLRAMIRRDFNHPSVILYSIGNEVSEPAKEEGVKAAAEMTEFIHKLDGNRAVTAGLNLMIISLAKKGNGIYKEDGSGRDESNDKKAAGMNSTMYNMIVSAIGPVTNMIANSKKADEATSPVFDQLDICGYNYASGRYKSDGKKHPDRVIVGSETYPQDIAKNWKKVKELPYLVGDFMWTAWDYLGEAGIGAWAYTPDGKSFSKPYPWLLGDTGAMDILGNPNGELFHASAVWEKLEKPVICVQPINHDVKPTKAAWRGTNSIPSWSWKGCEGRKAVVEVYTTADSVTLSLNGKQIGRKNAKGGKAVFKVTYEPGVLKAEAGGRTGELHSAAEAGICIHPETETVHAGQIVYVPVTIEDKNGHVESNADRRLTVTVENGELLAFGSANPRTEERFDEGACTTYYGQALAVVRAGKTGAVKLCVSDGSVTAESTIRTGA